MTLYTSDDEYRKAVRRRKNREYQAQWYRRHGRRWQPSPDAAPTGRPPTWGVYIVAGKLAACRRWEAPAGAIPFLSIAMPQAVARRIVTANRDGLL